MTCSPSPTPTCCGVVVARWIGLGPTAGALFVLGPATISVLGWERHTPVVVRWNDAAGDPLD